MKYQEYYLRAALAENGIDNADLAIDHSGGTAACTFNLVFPWSLINLCRGMWSLRTVKYSFQGLLTAQRQWVRSYPDAIIIPTSAGRERPRSVPDVDYYRLLARTEFVLCPQGDCRWTYRFFEAIMCGAIPVLRDVPHEQEAKFHFARHGQSHSYDARKVELNYALFVKTHAFAKAVG